MTTESKDSGRLKGGLLRVWRSERARELGWNVAGGVVGGVMGIIFAVAYLAYR